MVIGPLGYHIRLFQFHHHQHKQNLPSIGFLSSSLSEYMATDDNWGEFQVKFDDPKRSLEEVEAKVSQLEKTQEEVITKGREMRELTDKCTLNTKLRLEAMEKRQEKMRKVGNGLVIAVLALALFSGSRLLFRQARGWYLKKLGAEKAAKAEEQGESPKSEAPSLRTLRRNRRSHARQWHNYLDHEG